MQIGTNYYNVKLINDKGIEVKVNNVYTEKGFFDAGEIALKYVNSVNKENCKLVEITRVLRDTTITECMMPELCTECMYKKQKGKLKC